MSDITTFGAPYLIGQAIDQALRAAFSGEPDVLVLDNPARPSDLADGARVVWWEDQTDQLRAQPGQVAQRSFTAAVGVISRTSSARRQAHADYRAAKRALRSAMPSITTAGVTLDGAGLIEGEVSYKVEGIDVGGALVRGLISFDYRDKGG
jgi:hypothetical protein